jgi:hypothetical protein
MWAYEAKIGGVVTFKLLPVTPDSPFVEAAFDPESKALVILSKTLVKRLADIPRYDAKGKFIGSTKKEIDQFFEHIIENMEDIRSFVSMNVLNTKHEGFKLLDE